MAGSARGPRECGLSGGSREGRARVTDDAGCAPEFLPDLKSCNESLPLAIRPNPRPPQERCRVVPCRPRRPALDSACLVWWRGNLLTDRASSPKVSQVLASRRFTRLAKVIMSYLSPPRGAVRVFTSFSPTGEPSSSFIVILAPQVFPFDLLWLRRLLGQR